MTVAQTILAQLGGNKFIAMTGAKQFVAGSNAMQFAIGRGARNGINKVRVTLGADDMYNVEFWKIRGVKMDCVATVGSVFTDKLAGVFTEATGFDTHL